MDRSQTSPKPRDLGIPFAIPSTSTAVVLDAHDRPQRVFSPMVSLPKLFSNYHIKLFAAIFMVIDHVGAIFFPEIMLYRQIGRLSLPMFVWLLVKGETHTRSVWQYGLRLLAMGILSQPIYVLAFDLQGIRDYNILFTLLIGLVCLRLARQFPKALLFIWIGGAIAARFLCVDYGSYGIAMIAFISRFKPTTAWWLCWIGLHAMLLYVLPGYGRIQGFAVLTPLIFHMTTHEQGQKARWFYGFYPVHLLILYLIHWWIQSL